MSEELKTYIMICSNCGHIITRNQKKIMGFITDGTTCKKCGHGCTSDNHVYSVIGNLIIIPTARDEVSDV